MANRNIKLSPFKINWTKAPEKEKKRKSTIITGVEGSYDEPYRPFNKYIYQAISG